MASNPTCKGETKAIIDFPLHTEHGLGLESSPQGPVATGRPTSSHIHTHPELQRVFVFHSQKSVPCAGERLVSRRPCSSMSAVSLGQWDGPRGEQGKVSSAFNQTLLHTRATLVLAVPQGVNPFHR